MWATNGVQSDAGPAGAGNIKELGITNTGLPFCINSAPTSGPYYQTCFGASAGGSALITSNAYGGATPQALNFNINGSDYGFPGNGNGNVMGPNSSAVGELSSFNGTTGALIRQGPAHLTDAQTSAISTDGAGLASYSQSGLSALTIYGMTTNAPGIANYDVNRSVLKIPSGSLITNGTGFASYIEDLNPLGSGVTTGSAVNFFGVGVAAVNGAAVWGLNPVLTDNTTYASSGGTGRFLQNEFDFNVTSPNTTVHGLFVSGASLAQMAAGSDGFSCRIGNVGVWAWPICFQSVAGSATNAFYAGPAALTGASIPSQYLLFGFYDAAAALQSYNVRVNAGAGNGGTLEIASTLGAATQFQVDGLIKTPDSSAGNNNAFEVGALAASGTSVGSQAILWHWFNSGGTSSFVEAVVGTGGLWTLSGGTGYVFSNAPVTIADGVGITGSVSLSGVTNGGSATKYVCVDASGYMVVQSGAC
jgi:hypothetical protein